MLRVKRNCQIRIEASTDIHCAGGFSVFVEAPNGQWSLPYTLEIAPFDTSLDIVQWLIRLLVIEQVIDR